MRKSITSIIALTLFSTPLFAADDARVMVLGTFHFQDAGTDVVKPDVFNVMSDDGQSQVRDLVSKLDRFKPTKVLLEFRPDNNDKLSAEYQAWLAGKHEPGANEIEQLGYRLAKLNGHDEVYGIDNRDIEWKGGALFGYIKQHDPETDKQFQALIRKITEETNRDQKTLSLLEILRKQNSAASLRENLGLYVGFDRIGAGDGYAGADNTASWFERNIRMHGLIQQYAAPGERLLVIVGSGHAAVLNILLDYDPELERVDVLQYLEQ